jgi:aldehyde:ferredoxin oxidoreductase
VGVRGGRGGILSPAELDGIDMRWGNGEGALALTIKMGTGEGCGAWLRHGSASAAAHVGRGSERFAVHVHGQEPAYHDPRFTSLMGVSYISDPTPGPPHHGHRVVARDVQRGVPDPGRGRREGDRYRLEEHGGQGARARRTSATPIR